jgi:AraC-like DNA-binding protein
MAIEGPAAYTEWAAAPGLRALVACTWTGGVVPGPPDADPEPVLPDGCTDIIWDGASLFVAGPDTGPSAGGAGGTGVVVGLRLRPGAAPGVLGLPAAALLDQRVALAEVWPDAAELEDALAAARSTTVMVAALERHAARRRAEAEADPVVAAAARTWTDDARALSIAGLAEQANLTDRQLHRRFTAAVGYGPKVLQRVLRFQRFLRAAGASDQGLAQLAAEAGYADQAHLTREARALAGRTPAQLVARRRV